MLAVVWRHRPHGPAWRRESPNPRAEQDHPDTDEWENAVGERDEMLQALRILPSRQRACVVLRYYDELSVDEVAVALGISAGTVKSQTSKGLNKLRAALSQELASDAGGER